MGTSDYFQIKSLIEELKTELVDGAAELSKDFASDHLRKKMT